MDGAIAIGAANLHDLAVIAHEHGITVGRDMNPGPADPVIVQRKGRGPGHGERGTRKQKLLHRIYPSSMWHHPGGPRLTGSLFAAKFFVTPRVVPSRSGPLSDCVFRRDRLASRRSGAHSRRLYSE